MVKYSKKASDILDIKQEFFEKNQVLLEINNSISKIWRQQPKRLNCKICNEDLENSKHFTSHKNKYFICKKCGHVNGEYLDTEEFAKKIYIEGDYGSMYREENEKDYGLRMEKVYLPKFEFLIDSLKEDNFNVENLNLLDIGAGSGYFVSAGLSKGYHSRGIEVSSRQVDFANKMTNNNLECISSDNISSFIANTDANVISAIGVLEHIINLHDILKSIVNNKNIKYLFFSVPLFSFCCILESIWDNVYNRQLGWDHTHIFTFESIEYMSKMYGFEEISRWNFGTDIVDLYRSITIELQEKGNDYLCNIMHHSFSNILDDLQIVLDKNQFCSEVHMLLKINRSLV